jgi:nitric oxide reductase NorE protein
MKDRSVEAESRPATDFLAAGRSFSAVRKPVLRHLPGEEGLWVFIGGDLLVFSLFFGLFLYYRAQNLAIFEQSHLELNRGLGLLNTLVLLTSSLFVASAVTSARRGFHARAGRLLIAAIACGIVFGASKVFEYSAKFNAGIVFNTNDFFMFYFMLTGIHMVHVIFATGMLFYLWTRTRGVVRSAGYISVMEAGGIFWHLVDLLWVVLFALLYLLP